MFRISIKWLVEGDISEYLVEMADMIEMSDEILEAIDVFF